MSPGISERLISEFCFLLSALITPPPTHICPRVRRRESPYKVPPSAGWVLPRTALRRLRRAAQSLVPVRQDYPSSTSCLWSALRWRVGPPAQPSHESLARFHNNR